MKIRSAGVLLVACMIGAAQQPVVRPLGPVVATSPVAFRGITELVALSDGRIVVNDWGNKVAVTLSPALTDPVIVIDSASGKANSSGSSPGRLMAFRDDSLLFFEPTAGALLVLDPGGHVGRVMASPFGASEQLFIAKSSSVFGLVNVVNRPSGCAGVEAVPGGPPVVCEDSTAVVTGSLATRAVDTIAAMGQGFNTITSRDNDGKLTRTRAQQLYPFSDAFTVMHDGSIAVLRVRELRIEWITGDGKHTISPRIPFDWHHVTDDDRTRIVDSINASRTQAFETRLAKWLSDSAAGGGGRPVTRGGDADPPVGGRAGARGGGRAGGRVDGRAGPGVAAGRPRRDAMVRPDEIPDFLPPATSGSAFMADADDNVWIRLSPSSTNGVPNPTTYDVVNRSGVLIDRVSLPPKRSILGFSPGFVYLQWPQSGLVSILEKARIK